MFIKKLTYVKIITAIITIIVFVVMTIVIATNMIPQPVIRVDNHDNNYSDDHNSYDGQS